jgi:hypothetical protein
MVAQSERGSPQTPERASLAHPGTSARAPRGRRRLARGRLDSNSSIRCAPVFAVEVRSNDDYGAAAEARMPAKRADYFDCRHVGRVGRRYGAGRLGAATARRRNRPCPAGPCPSTICFRRRIDRSAIATRLPSREVTRSVKMSWALSDTSPPLTLRAWSSNRIGCIQSGFDHATPGGSHVGY